MNKIVLNFNDELCNLDEVDFLIEKSTFQYYDSILYVSSLSTVKKTLDKYGVAIIPNILTEKECEKMYSGAWDYLEHISQTWDIPMKRNDESTYREFYKLMPLHSMLLQHFGIGHSQFCWDVRQNPKVIEVFSTIWNTKDLLTSFDGASIHFPPEITGKGWYTDRKGKTTGGWLHTDQSYTRNDLECIQSWVTAFDVNEDDATLLFIEGSHKYHKEFAKEFGITDKSNWYKLEEEQVEFYTRNCGKPCRIKCPKGSIVLWDSRTIHCGTEPIKNREKENYRCVSYVCMLPKNLASKKDIEKKQKVFDELRTTSHWPVKTKLFAKTPRTYGNELPNITIINPPVLTSTGKKLVGY